MALGFRSSGMNQYSKTHPQVPSFVVLVIPMGILVAHQNTRGCKEHTIFTSFGKGSSH